MNRRLAGPRPTRVSWLLRVTTAVGLLAGCAACGGGPSSFTDISPPVLDPPTRDAAVSAGPQDVQIIGSYRSSDVLGYAIDWVTTDGPDVWSLAPDVGWVDSGSYLAIRSHGSGSCPSRPTSIEATADALVIDMGPVFPGQNACTYDLSTYIVLIAVPDGVDPTATTPVVLDGGTAYLPPAATEAPSPVEVRVDVPGQSVAAGQSVGVVVFLRNTTDTDVAVPTDCTGRPWVKAGLSSPAIPYTSFTAAVGCIATAPVLIPPGSELRVRTTLQATHQMCTQSPEGVDSLMPLCVPGAPGPPPLPPGNYTIDVLVEDLPSVRAVSPEQVKITR